MAFFNDDFESHDAVLSADFGESVTYTPPDGGSPSTDAKAVIDWDVGTDNADGLTAKPKREGTGVKFENMRRVGLRKSSISAPVLFATLTIEGDDWVITEIVGSDPARTWVKCERPESHEYARPDFRGRK